ncbi:MAG: hypothetical protein FWE09_07975 [Treponema sp.]|nr:hypothetical protein [Treponema sp.]
MKNIRLCLHFFKSTLVVNWGSSLALAAFMYLFFDFPFHVFFSLFLLTAGFALALFVKEASFTEKNTWFFYYNFSITKGKLMAFSTCLNAIFAAIIFWGFEYGKRIFGN